VLERPLEMCRQRGLVVKEEINTCIAYKLLELYDGTGYMDVPIIF